MEKILDIYTKDESSDEVAISLVYDDGIGRGNVRVKDKELCDQAKKEGKTTWDEDTICAVVGCVRRPPPPPPAPQPVEEVEHA